MQLSSALVPRVSGSTELFLIPGDPVEQVRAPEVFNRVFAALGINAVLVPVHVAPADIETFVRSVFLARNVKGLFLAIPHKALVMDMLDACSSLGRLAGAVNAIRRTADGRLEGGLFDGEGLRASLDYFGMAHAGRRVLILGAGGGAAAIGASLVGDVAELALYDPVPGKASSVAARLGACLGSGGRVRAAPGNDPAGFDLVIHASPLGLQPGDPLPLDVSRMAPHAVLVDILMKNQPTPLVRAVRERGLHAQPGFEMLIQQTPLYLEFFGYPEAAQAVRQDATFLRELIYPPQLAHEIRRPGDALKTRAAEARPAFH
ncbi:shikimate dehydrogenase [Hylemonella gracilis str. Niagara R]|uniref:Shikimate dehydrogenase n=1 Tax=Hylemonella gracilis str. Niagara R TaxID=1458275 RepID=A0A016XHT4_9BURK|nr:shikimate dehydrogenase [Hylemonella gracilis]EYC51092.1 shikimate dehydrogenase [Hylemonella gracilis str. Niagara R]